MAFKPNYGQMRAERQRTARTRNAEKQQKLEQRAMERKAAREPANPAAQDERSSNTTEDGRQ